MNRRNLLKSLLLAPLAPLVGKIAVAEQAPVARRFRYVGLTLPMTYESFMRAADSTAEYVNCRFLISTPFVGMPWKCKASFRGCRIIGSDYVQPFENRS